MNRGVERGRSGKKSMGIKRSRSRWDYRIVREVIIRMSEVGRKEIPIIMKCFR